MIPRPPGSTPTDPLFPYPTRFRSYRCEDLDIERVELGDGQDVRTARTAIFADRHRALGDDAVDRATHSLFGQDALRAEIFELGDALILRGGALFLRGGLGVGLGLLALVAREGGGDFPAAAAARIEIGGPCVRGADRKSGGEGKR